MSSNTKASMIPLHSLMVSYNLHVLHKRELPQVYRTCVNGYTISTQLSTQHRRYYTTVVYKNETIHMVSDLCPKTALSSHTLFSGMIRNLVWNISITKSVFAYKTNETGVVLFKQKTNYMISIDFVKHALIPLFTITIVNEEGNILHICTHTCIGYAYKCHYYSVLCCEQSCHNFECLFI